VRRAPAISSVVAGGCIVSGAFLRKSLLFTGVRVHSYANVEGAVILPDVEIGRGARLRNVIIERGTKIPEGLQVGWDPELDGQRFRMTSKGICLVNQRMIDRIGQ
jgi:glucose-1-phosphate adenylyltransferase